MTTAESNIAANGSIINTVKNSVYTTDQTDKLLQTYKQGSRNYIRNGNFRGAIRNSTTVPYWSWWGTDGHVWKNNGLDAYTGDGALWWGTTSTSNASLVSSDISKDKIPDIAYLNKDFILHDVFPVALFLGIYGI